MYKLISRSLFVGTLVSLPMLAPQAEARILQEITESTRTARGVEASNSKGGSSCNRLNQVSSPVRGGRVAFEHWVEKCGERSEFSTMRTRIGSTYWYGWSVYIPDRRLSDSYDILAQWATYPTSRRFACGANGSYMIRSGDSISFNFQRQGERSDVECSSYSLGSTSEFQGKWVDFVMHAKWTGNRDGFVRLWTKVGNGSYVQKVNYTGRTFWNDEGDGPYFKMGLYKGDPNWSGAAPQYIYTDEFRLGDVNSNFDEVAPRR